MNNQQIAAAFEQIGHILSLLDENPFKIRAYDRAAQTIGSLSEEVSATYKRGGTKALEEIPGIGKDLALKMEEMVETGKLTYLAEVSKKVPAGVIQITGIQGMGPKKTKFLWKKFKVTTVDALEKLAKSGKLDTEKGWGEKSIENVLKGIEAMRLHNERIALPSALAVAEQMVAFLQESKLCTRIEIAGSVRRRKESIGDVDILVTSKKVEEVMDVFCSFELVDRVLAKGGTRASVHLSTGINMDLRVLEDASFGAALHYFTGSKEHNIALRRLGNELGLTISEYGVYKGTAEKKGKLVAAHTEEDIYKSVGLPYIPPELREDRGEMEAAKKAALPRLIEIKDLKGDLHMHTNFSDGNNTAIEMAKAAQKAGHSYIALTDHASPMGMVFGIKENNINEYLEKIEEARKAVKGIEIFAGAEVDILEDGSLYLPDSILKKLDWVIVSVHGNFNLSSDAMTKRIIKALKHPHVHAFAHPTSRLLLKRDPISYDTDAVFKVAAEHKVALEINASKDRLDLNDVLARKAKEMGCMIVIDSDAHHARELDYRFGITQARRAWLEKGNVLNTMSVAQVKKWMNK